jgi:hypothetical protein
MKIMFLDSGDRSVGIKPLIIEFKVNEKDHSEEWLNDFKNDFIELCEIYFDINGKLECKYEDD